MDTELAGKVVLVTGGTDGLGEALVDRLAAEGTRVAFCARNEDRLRAMEARLQIAGGEVLGVAADVTVADDLRRFVESAVSKWGQVNALVNNAGKSIAGSIESVGDEDWIYDFHLKVMAAVRLIRLVLPHMRAQNSGSIVNVLNIGSKAPGARTLPTTASRAAGLAITKALSKELGPDNIRVNAVLIGGVKSGQQRRRSEETGIPLEEIYAERSKGVPLGRMGEASEYADLVTYLLSPRSSYVTGSAINLDGGLSPVW